MAIGDWSEDHLRETIRQVIRQAPEAALLRAQGAGILSGNGSPAGVIDAPVGTLYRRLDGGAGTVLYVNEGGGTGGWVAK